MLVAIPLGGAELLILAVAALIVLLGVYAVYRSGKTAGLAKAREEELKRRDP